MSYIYQRDLQVTFNHFNIIYYHYFDKSTVMKNRNFFKDFAQIKLYNISKYIHNGNKN